MTFAIVQKELVMPDLEPMKRAFCSLEGLTSLDAQAAANDAYGILVRGLDAERVGALQAALNYEGIASETVPESELPSLPTGRVVRRIQFGAQDLATFDSMQHEIRIPYGDVLFIAAGLVHTREHRPAPLSYDNSVPIRGREEEHDWLVIDFFLIDGTRFSITANEFNFDGVGDEDEALPARFVQLVRKLEKHAPGASLNRGAFLACQEPPEWFSYPSRQAYHEEIIWMLWRIQKLLVAASQATDATAG